MSLLLLAVGVLLLSGLAALSCGKSNRASLVGAAGVIVAALVAIIPVFRAVSGSTVETLRASWQVPGGSFNLGLDALSGFFLLPILVLSVLAAVYGAGYLKAYAGKKHLGAAWFFFNLLVAGMMLVVTARNGLLFLVAWEVMSLASFFLVTFESERPEVRQAGWTYLVATHIGTAFLLALFVLLGQKNGSLDFDAFKVEPSMASLLFVFAVIGFGTKAGFMPLHVWLPEAHPAAPSHVSALMSGVMIKTGIYGVLRTLTFLGEPPAWWGWLLIGIGVASGLLGVLFALTQQNLKRLLAYSSVENIGIVSLGLGVGLLGISHHLPVLAVLGFAGALLHVLNHACFKGLLFLGAGAVLHSAGTLSMDRLGGLLKKMPQTAIAFVVGSAAICALPPFNGFVGEFLIYLGSYRGLSSQPVDIAVPLLAVIVSLALIGGLAAACFTKAFGIVFLGEPRTADVSHAHEPTPAMRIPLLVLACFCALLGICAPLVLRGMQPLLSSILPLPREVVREQLVAASQPLFYVTLVGCVLILFVAALSLLRRRLLSHRPVGETGTWDCGYAQPTSRIQYTGSSFTQPLDNLFEFALRTRRLLAAPADLFPQSASLKTETPDVSREYGFRPLFCGIAWMLGHLRWLQHGRVHLYVLYIAVTLLVLLLWRMS